MKQYTAFLLFCFILTACYQTEPNPTLPVEAPVQDSLPFPQSWLGNWTGDLEIFKDNQLVQTIPMELEMMEIDTSENYIWAIIYGKDRETGLRAYELEIVDASKGQYRVDEKNTINLETYLFGNKLMSWYEVMGSQILSIYEKKGDQMTFEIIFGSAEPVSITGDQMFQGEEVPAVRTFPIGGYQRAVLSRKK